jgi:threonine synthase
MWQAVESGEGFDLGRSGDFSRIGDFGFVSGRSTHADRLATIRMAWEKYGTVIDTHTADGLKVGLEHREAGVPLVCLETALPAKFEETIVEALGRKPERPAGLEDIESMPRRVEVMDADAEAIKAFIARHADD